VADTTAPLLRAVETPDSLTVVLVFDDLLDSTRAVAEAVFKLKTPDSLGTPLAIDSVYLDSKHRRRVILKPAYPLEPGSFYYVESAGVVNQAGFRLQPGQPGRTFRYRPSTGEPDDQPRGRRR